MHVIKIVFAQKKSESGENSYVKRKKVGINSLSVGCGYFFNIFLNEVMTIITFLYKICP